MKALIYQGPGKMSWTEKPKPQIVEATDAVVRILKTTICGTDLHIFKGDVPTVTAGRTIGHEGIGVVEAIGAAVTVFKVGDRVVISCISSCGKCAACKEGMPSHCATGGWILGNTIDGTQADFVRIPYADFSLHAIPAGQDEEAMVMLSDILPTGYECGVLNSKIHPGDSVAIVGAGPIGMATLMTAQFFAPALIIVIDHDATRLAQALTIGATHTIDSSIEDPVAKVMEYTGGKGVDAAIEAVGIAETFEMCTAIVAAGGHVANIGVHGASACLHLETLWSRNITITTRLVDGVTTPKLLKIVTAGKLDPKQLITHRFALSEIVQAYEVFGHAAEEKALKVILSNEGN